MGIFSRIKEKFMGEDLEEGSAEEYVELDTSEDADRKARVVVRPFVIENFEDVKTILDSLREGYTIALVNIKPLKDKDLIELKRAVAKLKKTVDAVGGDIAGFGDDWIAMSPSFAKIYRTKTAKTEVKQEAAKESDDF